MRQVYSSACPRRSLLLLALLIASVFVGAGEWQPPVIAIAPELPGLVAEIPLRVQTASYELDAQGLRVPGYRSSEIPGAPALPLWSKVVTLPASGEWEVSYTSEGTQQLALASRLPAAPVPDWRAISRPDLAQSPLDSIPLLDQPDPAIYGADAFYPTTPIITGTEQWQRGQRLLVVRAFPFQYNPVAGTLLYHPDLLITIRVRSVSVKKISQPSGGTAAVPSNVAGALRIHTDERGFYRLDYADLQTAGAPVGTIDPATFAMTYQGQPIDIQRMDDGDGSFEPGEAVRFYAEPYSGRYLTHNVYWFTYGGTPSPAIRTRSAPQQGPVVNQLTQTLHVEANRAYLSAFDRPATGDKWFDSAISVNNSQPPTTTIASRTYTLPLDDPLLTGEVQLRAVLHGTTDLGPNPDHSILVQLNNHEVGRYSWDGAREQIISATLPATWLDGAPNRLTLVADLSVFPPDTLFSYTVYPDYLELAYTALADAEGDRLYIEQITAGQKEVVVTGFSAESGGNVRVYDVRDPHHPVQLGTLQAENTGSGYTVRFWDSEATARYFLTSEAALLTPTAIELDTPSSWRSPDHQADYIAIVHPSLSSALQPLLQHRSAEGLRVVEVAIQDIYDEFSAGRMDPEAIRDFLGYAYHNWNGQGARPRYVLLVGDGHYDFKNYLGQAAPNLIPPYLANVDPWINETVADNRYVSVDGPADYLPDMHLGRLPARTPADITAIVDKIITYETASVSGDWQKRVVYVADAYNDPAGNFHALSDAMRQNALPSAYTPESIYYKSTTYDTATKVRAAVRARFDQDAFMIQWFGHGARNRWGSVDMFSNTDIGTLVANSEYPLTVSYACWTNYYITLFNNNAPTLGEALIFTPERGSIADIGPTGLHVGGALAVLGEGITEAIFQQRIERVGEVADASKLYLYESNSWHDIIDTTLVLGDPATRLRLPAMPRLLDSQLSASTTAPRGSTVPFTLSLVNDGSAPASNVVATVDYTQTNLSIIAAPGATDSGDALTWNVVTLPVGTTVLTFTAQLNDTLAEGTRIDTAALIQSSGQFDLALTHALTVTAALPTPTATPRSGATRLYLPILRR